MNTSEQTSKRASGQMITRKGKIARLPHRIREEINRRLFDGQDSADILPWLNALPEVKERMAARFKGATISSENLSQWRLGGYAEWLAPRHFSGRK